MNSGRSPSRLGRLYPWAFALLGLFGATVYYFTGGWFPFFREKPVLLINLFDIHPTLGFLVYGVVGWVTGWLLRALDRFQVSR